MSTDSVQTTSPETQTTDPASPAATTETTTTKAASLIGGEQEQTTATEWTEYVNDDTKTAEENAAAKTAHDATKPDAAKSEKKEEAPKVEPLTIENIKLPEGFSVDEPVMNKFLGLLNDSEMSPQDRAQALVDLQIESFTQASERASSAWQELQTERQEEWANDPAVGGEKQAVVAAAGNKLLAQYGTPELAELIGQSGVGNSVYFARFINSISPFLLEGKPVTPTTPANAGGYSPTNLYPTQGTK